MTETIQKAINKIDLEAEEEKNTYARVFASHIIDNYLSTDENAEKVLDEKKTIAGCLREVKSKAQKQAESGMAMSEDSTVFGWVREYYGFTDESRPAKIIDLFDVL